MPVRHTLELALFQYGKLTTGTPAPSVRISHLSGPKEFAMVARITLFAGLAAALIYPGEVAAQRRRFTPVVSQPPVAAQAKTDPAPEPLKQVVYNVADLVVPISTEPNLDVEPLPNRSRIDPVADQPVLARPRANFLPGLVNHPTPMATKPETINTLEESLITLIHDIVVPKSWLRQGGPGTIQYFPLGHALVVQQTQAVHDELKSLFQALRRLQDLEAAVEVRIIQVRPGALDQARRDLNLTCKNMKNSANPPEAKWIVGPTGPAWTSFLKENQVSRLIKTLQADATCNVMQSPKITMLNGQIARVEVSDQQCLLTRAEITCDDVDGKLRPLPESFTTGFRLALKPVVSADRRSTELEMNGYWSGAAGPVTKIPVQTRLTKEAGPRGVKEVFVQTFLQKPRFNQIHLKQKVDVTDGETFVVNAGVVPVEVPCQDCLSWFAERLTGQKMTTSEDRCILFLVTPRVIVNEAEEPVFQGTVPAVPRP